MGSTFICGHSIVSYISKTCSWRSQLQVFAVLHTIQSTSVPFPVLEPRSIFEDKVALAEAFEFGEPVRKIELS